MSWIWPDSRAGMKSSCARGFSHILPDGWFLIEHRAGSEIVATAMATHRRRISTHLAASWAGWQDIPTTRARAGHGCVRGRRAPSAPGRLQEHLPQDRRLAPARTEHLPEAGVDPSSFCPTWRNAGATSAPSSTGPFARGLAREPQLVCQNCASHHGVMDRIAYNGRDSPSGCIELRERGISERLASRNASALCSYCVHRNQERVRVSDEREKEGLKMVCPSVCSARARPSTFPSATRCAPTSPATKPASTS